jgi:hypothetical protein
VHLEEHLVGGPVRLARDHPADAVLGPALHLHDMGDGVVGPAVARLLGERRAPGGLGAGVVAGLLEAEGVHAEHRRPAGHVLGPVRQGAGDAVAQGPGVGAVEVGEVAGLEGDDVALLSDPPPFKRKATHGPGLGHAARPAPLGRRVPGWGSSRRPGASPPASAPRTATPRTPPPRSIIAYHYVSSGRLLVGVDGEAPVEAAAGEVVVLPRNDAHILGSSLEVAAVAGEQLVEPAADGGLARIVHGGGGAETRILCGYLGSESAADPVIASLPRVMKIAVADGPTGFTSPSHPWILPTPGSSSRPSERLASARRDPWQDRPPTSAQP